MRIYIIGIAALLATLTASAQRFFNLTAEEVRIDSVLPVFHYAQDVGYHYADSTYTVIIEYPEFVSMSAADIARYRQLTADERPGALPDINQGVSVSRKRGMLHVSFTPIVCREGQYQKLVSFMLRVKSQPAAASRRLSDIGRRTPADRYAANSVLADGRWVKISVTETGIWQLTDELVRQAGFSSLERVKIYGYGGALQPEQLTADYISATDDLQELPTCYVDGRRLFYGVGPVNWNSNHQRIRNPYSTCGVYFLTENDAAATTLSWDDFKARYEQQEVDHCTLYEVDDFAWYQGGRNLYDSRVLTSGGANSYTVGATGEGDGTVTIALSAYSSTSGSVRVFINGTEVGTITTDKAGSYDAMRPSQRTFSVSNLATTNTITLIPSANSGTVRLDYISTYSPTARAFVYEGQSFGVPTILHAITNQNHHADPQADMVIIISTNQQLRQQAERLKTLHEEMDGLRVSIVPADELYNEFSSGTPDANAYRRYMKMLYDRAATDDDMPRYLLLLGDCAWDNRMLTTSWKGYSPDDFLLCYESENSYNHIYCYVSDDYFGLLDDGEGGSILTSDKCDLAIGRIPARTDAEASVVVDKIESYVHNQEAGTWQNQLCFMGDDGNENAHMQDANDVAAMVEQNYPHLFVKRIMWDAYTRESSATGNRYPEATRAIRQQMQQGALVMNYSGHGNPTSISHEYVLQLADFQTATSLRLPLWVTASCDIMPFDGQSANIGETALFNTKGGAIAFYGTARTVYQPQNRIMNLAFMRHVLRKDATGKPTAIGEAVRLTKNELVTGYDPVTGEQRSTNRDENRMQYALLGDPALRLAMPTQDIEVTTINGVDVSSGVQTLKAASTATIEGRILSDAATTDERFNGVVTATIRDVPEQITCRLNDTGEASTAFVYTDRPNTIYNGSNTVKDGVFTLTFAVPKDIQYSDLTALINLYAVNDDKTQLANGTCEQLSLNGTTEDVGGAAGPSIYCYLNSETFSNGDNVNTTPYFVATLHDEDGINVGGGLGHSLQLVIDGSVATTYELNDYFQYDFGSYQRGKIGYSIPKLAAGPHKLLFRAWDVLNNSSTSELTFNVVEGLEPLFVDVECSPNPASQQTTFRVIHDRIESEVTVKLDVFDTSGRHLWSHSESGVSSDNVYTLNWDLSVAGGSRLGTGLYLYRVGISSEGSSYTSKTKKLIVLTNK